MAGAFRQSGTLSETKTKDAPRDDIQLGDYRLTLRGDGKWSLVSGPAVPGIQLGSDVLERQIQDLMAEKQQWLTDKQRLEKENQDLRVQNLELRGQLSKSTSAGLNLTAPLPSPPVAPQVIVDKSAQLQLEQTLSQLQQSEMRNYQLQQDKAKQALDRDRLEFKVKVLLAMCTISEGDYLALCKDAGVLPKGHAFRT